MPRRYSLTEEGRAARASRRNETTRALLDAARKLFTEQGYDGVSVVEIGRLAGVSHTLINTYFGGKAGLLYALVEAANAPQLEATRAAVARPDPAMVRLRAVFSAWAEADLADPRAFQVLQSYAWTWSAATEAKNRAERLEFRKALEQLIVEGRARGEFPPGAPESVLSEAMVAIYLWGIRSAVYAGCAASAAIDDLWPQVEALLGVAAD